MPGLSRSTAQSYLPHMEKAMIEHGITTLPRIQMWLAQVGHESLSLRYMEEIASGQAYEGRRDLGNVQPGDGRRFKGRGPIQLTGRHNYTAAAKALNLPLVENPAMAAEPKHAFRVSAWWWTTHGLNPISDRGDVIGATRRINGGLNGLSDRQSRFARIRQLGNAVLLEAPPEPGERPQPVIPPLPKGVIPVAIALGVMKDGRFEVFVEAQPAKAGEAGQVFHAWQARDGGWAGAEPGKRVAKWESMGTPGKQ